MAKRLNPIREFSLIKEKNLKVSRVLTRIMHLSSQSQLINGSGKALCKGIEWTETWAMWSGGRCTNHPSFIARILFFSSSSSFSFSVTRDAELDP
jgi:hypothetical protein